MKKIILLAAAAATVAASPAMAKGEGRVEGRSAIGFGGGASDFFAGISAGYDFDLGETAFVGPEVSYDSNLTGADLLNAGGRLGAKVGERGKIYVVASYELADADSFNAGVGFQQSFNDKAYGKIEYRRYFLNGTDLNFAGVGFGLKF